MAAGVSRLHAAPHTEGSGTLPPSVGVCGSLGGDSRRLLQATTDTQTHPHLPHYFDLTGPLCEATEG